MHRQAEATLSDHFVVTARLKQAFEDIKRDAKLLRYALAFCISGLAVTALMVAHHMFDLPALSFFWALIVSICT